MPKYVPKEDVEKGLVDPTKPLAEQPQYLSKLEQERPKQDEKKPPARPRKEYPPRNPRPTFNWNKNDVTLETVAPEKPKKLLEKPSREAFNDGLNKLKAQREALINEKKKLVSEKHNVLKDLSENKKTGRSAISQYSGEMKEKFNIQSQLWKQINGLLDKKKKLEAELGYLQQRQDELRKPSTDLLSSEQLNNRIEQKEHQLTTGDIGKREEARLYNEINELKRALLKARPSIEIETELGKLKDQIDIIYKQLRPIKAELKDKFPQAHAIKAELQVLTKQMDGEKGAIKQQMSPEDIKKDYDAKIAALEQRRNKLEDRIDDHYHKYQVENDLFQDQQDLLRYIDWVNEQIQKLKKRKEDEQRRKKEQEEYEKRKLKEKEEYEKRKEERKKADEERKAKEEERKLKLQQEREAYINKNPNHQLIDLCEDLISYCQGLKPIQQHVDTRKQQAGEVVLGKEWQKELKGGAQLVISKKSKADEEKQPKHQKPAKKKEEEEQDFSHNIEAINQFQKINLLPPARPAEIDQTIKHIQDKITIFNQPTEQEKAAYKEKAAKEFDERHAPREGRDNRDRNSYKQKNEEESPIPQPKAQKAKRYQKKNINQNDFPGLA